MVPRPRGTVTHGALDRAGRELVRGVPVARSHGSLNGKEGVEPTLGFEPRTCCLRNSCSTAELCRRRSRIADAVRHQLFAHVPDRSGWTQTVNGHVEVPGYGHEKSPPCRVAQSVLGGPPPRAGASFV